MTELEIVQQELALYKMVVRNQSITIDQQNAVIDGLAEAARQADNECRYLLACYRIAASGRAQGLSRITELKEQCDVLCDDLTAIAKIVEVWQ
jgi:hypothetical protein